MLGMPVVEAQVSVQGGTASSCNVLVMDLTRHWLEVKNHMLPPAEVLEKPEFTLCENEKTEFDPKRGIMLQYFNKLGISMKDMEKAQISTEYHLRRMKVGLQTCFRVVGW